jgi:transketolase
MRCFGWHAIEIDGHDLNQIDRAFGDAVSINDRPTVIIAQTINVYLRTTRMNTPVIYPPAETFPIGGSKVLRSSDRNRLTAIGAGVTLHEALTAYDRLKTEGIAIRVTD